MFVLLQGYPVSKTLAERAAWKFAKENNIALITVIPSLITGASDTPQVPSSIALASCLLTGKISPLNLTQQVIDLLLINYRKIFKETPYKTSFFFVKKHLLKFFFVKKHLLRDFI